MGLTPLPPCPPSPQTVPSLNIAYTQEKGYVTADIAEKENLTKLNLSGEGGRGEGEGRAIRGS